MVDNIDGDNGRARQPGDGVHQSRVRVRTWCWTVGWTSTLDMDLDIHLDRGIGQGEKRVVSRPRKCS